MTGNRIWLRITYSRVDSYPFAIWHVLSSTLHYIAYFTTHSTYHTWIYFPDSSPQTKNEICTLTICIQCSIPCGTAHRSYWYILCSIHHYKRFLVSHNYTFYTLCLLLKAGKKHCQHDKWIWSFKQTFASKNVYLNFKHNSKWEKAWNITNIFNECHIKLLANLKVVFICAQQKFVYWEGFIFLKWNIYFYM